MIFLLFGMIETLLDVSIIMPIIDDIDDLTFTADLYGFLEGKFCASDFVHGFRFSTFFDVRVSYASTMAK